MFAGWRIILMFLILSLRALSLPAYSSRGMGRTPGVPVVKWRNYAISMAGPCLTRATQVVCAALPSTVRAPTPQWKWAVYYVQMTEVSAGDWPRVVMGVSASWYRRHRSFILMFTPSMCTQSHLIWSSRLREVGFIVHPTVARRGNISMSVTAVRSGQIRLTLYT